MNLLTTSSDSIQRVATPDAVSADEPRNDSRLPERAPDDVLAPFVEVRPRLFRIAYRILGSVTEAEDIVQNVWLRWQGTNRRTVAEPAALLATITARLAINLAESACSRYQSYVGTWNSEPASTNDDPYLAAERSEALEIAVFLLFEKLTPTERAAYVLREAFDYPYEEIAGILRSTETNARQLVSRARKHINNGRRSRVNSDDQHHFRAAFEAAQGGDVGALERFLQKG